MSNEKGLFSIGSDIDVISGQLEEVQLLIEILDEEIERGLQSKDKIVEWEAVCFVKRIPMHLALLRSIERDLAKSVSELDSLSSELIEASKVQRREATT